jgi:hypothetical protein
MFALQLLRLALLLLLLLLLPLGSLTLLELPLLLLLLLLLPLALGCLLLGLRLALIVLGRTGVRTRLLHHLHQARAASDRGRGDILDRRVCADCAGYQCHGDNGRQLANGSLSAHEFTFQTVE